jgi:photosystem II stability/assembly factor-like uncharacterized protein
VGGTLGSVYYSTNATTYANWTQLTVPETMQINAIASYDGIVVYLVGVGNSDSKGRIYKSSDSGSSWTKLTTLGSTVALYSISITSDEEIMVQGASLFVSRSLDGGSTWSTMSVYTSGTTTSTRPPHALSMLSRTIAYSGSISGAMKMTVNGGSSWSTATTLAQAKSIYSIKIYSTDVGIAGESLLVMLIQCVDS